MISAGQFTSRSLGRIVSTGALVVGGVVGFGTVAGAATGGAVNHAGDKHDHESMMNMMDHESMMSTMSDMEDVPMGRMHGKMMSSSADMRRTHAHMMDRHPEMREMHAGMVSGGRSSSSG